MKVLHILKSKPSASIISIINTQKSDHDVMVVNLYENDNIDYEHLIELIENSDKVITW